MGGGGGGGGSPPQLVAPREVPLSETFAKFLGQEAQVPALQAFASNVNKQFREQLETGLPGTLSATTQVSSLVNQLLQGAIPSDVQTLVNRTSAEQAQAVGLPGGSEMARNLVARDFGFTSMDLMQQGIGYTPGLLEMSNFLSPQQTQNYLFSTGQLRGEDVKKAADDANVANQNAINKYNYDQQKARSSGGIFGSIGGLVGGIGGAALGSVVPGVGTAIGGMLGSALGGSIGSFAGGGSFAPTSGAGAFGGILGSMGGMMGGGAGGGGGGGLSPTMFNPIGQAFTMPSAAFGAPQYSGNMVYDFLKPSYPGGYGGTGSFGVKGF